MIAYTQIEGFGEISAVVRAKRDFNIQAAASLGWGGKARVRRGTGRKLEVGTGKINHSTHSDEQTDKDAFWQAVNAFQAANGITVDGKLGAATWRKLLLVSGLPDEKAIIKWSVKSKKDPGTTAPPQVLPKQWADPPSTTLPAYTTPPVTLPRPPAPGMVSTPPSLRPPLAPPEVVLPTTSTPPAQQELQPAQDAAEEPWYKRTVTLVAGGVGLLGLAVGGVVLYRRRSQLNGFGSWYNPSERMSTQKARQQFEFLKENIRKKMGNKYLPMRAIYEQYGLMADRHLDKNYNKTYLEAMRVILEIEEMLANGNNKINCDLEALIALGHTL